MPLQNLDFGVLPPSTLLTLKMVTALYAETLGKLHCTEVRVTHGTLAVKTEGLESPLVV